MSVKIIFYICEILAFVCAITFHEFMHGFAAYKLGDDTAARNGRLSFNPLHHIDPFGTVILPALMLFVGGPVFGYAKPVPFNPNNFKNRRTGELIVAVAGPLGNLILALVGVLLIFLIDHTIGTSLLPVAYFTSMFLPMLVLINLYLMFFNLIPIPPLDGSSIIVPFVPDRYMPVYYRVQQYAMPVLLIILFLLPYCINVDLIGLYLNATAGNVYNLLMALV